jgi:DNA polymerase III subunit gamma/tau
MATQSLYRRYRPRRFSEVKGQDHVTKALRNAVANGRQGHAYLFSGPRGTGKTSTARILAKVLNCERPVDGEPCCECQSCVAVEAGTSFDVHELDAASNNGVESMRELIDKAMLGTPGRHKVYILDEVHMLSKGAEGALLKTLEEPPPHVVFVLATTDPQKVSETIRSRTQPFQFHLLAMDVMEDHIRWLASDAHLELDEAALDAVLRQGGGSARDTISSLEVVLAGGGVAPEETPLDEFVEALIEADAGRALAAVAASIHQGRDTRVLTESIVAHLRDCFLCLMAPELVALTDQRASEVGRLAERLGPALTVRSIETLGSMLIEMRHAPDPRVLLEVALVKLTTPAVEGSVAELTARVAKLERLIAAGGVAGTTASVASAQTPPVSEARATFGSRARRPQTTAAGEPPTPPVTLVPTPPTTAPSSNAPSSTAPSSTAPSSNAPSSTALSSTAPSPTATAPTAPSSTGPAPTRPTSTAPSTTGPASTRPTVQSPTGPATTRPAPANSPAASPGTGIGADRGATTDPALVWNSVSSTLRPIAKALYGNGHLVGVGDGAATFAFPTEGLRKRGEEHRPEVESALATVVGAPTRLTLIIAETTGSAPASDSMPDFNHQSALPADDDVDLDDLVDAPTAATVSPIDRLAAAFPGVTMTEES